MVFEEVLPSIRKHGAYATDQALDQWLNDPDSMIQALTALKDERARAEAAELEARRSAKVIQLQAPLVAKATAHSGVEHAVGKQDFARQVQQFGLTKGADIKQRDVFALLERKGLLISGNRLDRGQITAQSVRQQHGWNKRGVAENGHEYVKPQITKKGQDLAWKWVHAAFAEHGAALNPRKAS